MQLMWISDPTKWMVLAETCSLHKPRHHSNPHGWGNHENLWKAFQTPSIGLWLISSMGKEEKPAQNELAACKQWSIAKE